VPTRDHATTATRAAAPVRMCVACRRRRPQHELVRLAAGPAGVRLDLAGNLPGRGAYVCPEDGCVERARKRGGAPIRRALGMGEADDVMRVLDAVGDAAAKEQEA
jgi:uncharacterized protein